MPQQSSAVLSSSILLAAWRGKLTNEEWESRIRKALPRGVNGDVYDLADCLLKQALVGPVPNQLFISYLKHAVKCELVSHSAVLSSIAHQSPTTNHTRTISSTNLHRTSSIICLLEFLKTFRGRISCKGTEIECLNLCHSISQLLHWLLKCVQHSLESIMGGGGGGGANNSQQANTINNNNNNSSASTTIPPSMALNLNMSTLSSTPTPIGTPIPTISGPINVAQHESTLRIIDLCTETINYFIDRPFTKSLIFISKIEYSREFDDILKTVQAIQQKLSNCPNFLQSIQDRIPHLKIIQRLTVTFNSRDMHPSVVAAQQLRCLQMHRIRSTHVTSGSNFEKQSSKQLLLVHDSTTNYALFNSLYSLIAFDVILRPARSHKLLARQIATITNFNSAPIHMTFCELIRICMIGLIDADGTSAKVKWAFFTFLKMPKLLLELNRVFKCYSQPTNDSTTTTNLNDCFPPPMPPPPNNQQNTNFISNLRLAFERLCEYSPLLDEAEFKCNCDIFKCLVKELIKNDQTLVQLKNMDFRKFPSKRAVVSNNDSSFGGYMMLKTEPVVTSMLQTFDSEQDPAQLFALLGDLVSGKGFEFTLNAAASTGRLQMFVKKLVEHNELNRAPRSDPPKNPQIQALIFDITFLILTYIAQQYGPDVIGTDQQTTFNKWFYDCYNPETRINCPKEMLKNCDEDIVSSLISQLAQPDGEGLQTKNVNWREVCFNLPKAVNEIIVAWNQGELSDNQVRGIIERIKSKMCFVAVVTAIWLQCYIRTLNESDKEKPLSFLHSLTKASQQAKLTAKQVSTSDPGSHSESYTERSSLMCSIIRKIHFEIVPKISTLTSSSGQNSTTTTTQSTALNVTSGLDTDESHDESAYQSINDRFISTLNTQEIFLANVKQCLSRGWMDHKSLNSLSSLFKMIGSECFTNLIVEQILTSHESPSDLGRAVNISFGLFHLDIEACAFALLKDTIPSWLMGEKKQLLLNQPRAFALAHLTVMTIIEVFNNLKASQTNNTDNNQQQQAADKKLSANGIKIEPGYQRQQAQQTTIMMDIDHSTANGPKDIKRIKLTPTDTCEKDLSNVAERLDKLNECISYLMRLFKEIMSDSVMSQRTLFPVLFLQQTVVCTREGSSAITVHLQPEILLDIINLFSSELTFELVLAISNLSTTNSRKYAAKAMCQLALVKESTQNTLIKSK